MQVLPALPNNEYAVGIITALSLELTAARACLDVIHGKPQWKNASDNNTYSLGCIGDHKVVVACLLNGVYGTTSAAVVASQMLSSFPSIRFGLMVGIGGGAQSEKHDIRLGDIVVSEPSGPFGGVVQYDNGKAKSTGFELKGF
jgi:nucleoside phosphorylase